MPGITSYACSDAKSMYKTQRPMKKQELKIFGKVGPPSSALPKNARLLLTINPPRVVIAHSVKINTLKLRDGSTILNSPP